MCVCLVLLRWVFRTLASGSDAAIQAQDPHELVPQLDYLRYEIPGIIPASWEMVAQLYEAL